MADNLIKSFMTKFFIELFHKTCILGNLQNLLISKIEGEGKGKGLTKDAANIIFQNYMTVIDVLK